MTGEVVIGVEARAFNATIRNRRKQMGLTQKQLAAKAGVKTGVVGTLETLRHPKVTADALRVLKVLGLDETASPDWLAALDLYGTRTVEKSVTAELVAAPELLGIPMFTSVEEDPEETALDHELSDEMRQAMGALHNREQQILRYHLDEMPHEQIGRIFGITRARVHQIVYQAENKLCDLLGQPRIHVKKDEE